MDFAELLRRERSSVADEWFDVGLMLEPDAPGDACNAYRKALLYDARHADAHVNLGRLLHEQGQILKAAAHYRRALRSDAAHVIATFNLGVAFEEMNRPLAAIDAYQRCLILDPQFADAHFNLAALLEKSGDQRGAIRHFTTFRALGGPQPQ